MGCSCKKDGWTAILDMMPPGKPRLTVRGTAECTTTGYKDVKLVEQQPPGINPRILLLKLVWEEPSGGSGDMITPHRVEFRKDPSPEYDQVEIVNCDVKIKVEIVV